MNKTLLVLLLSISYAQADVVGAKQGYGDAYQTNPLGSKQPYQDYKKSTTPPPHPARPAPAFNQSASAPATTPVQGIPFSEIKTKFGNLRNLLQETQNLVQTSNFHAKYGTNIQMVSEELAKLEHAVSNGRDLQYIPDHEVLENKTFGKSSFDQEKYNNLLGITKQTAMSACTEMMGSLKQGLRSNAGRANTTNVNKFIQTCSSLKGTQDVPQFVSMVKDLSALNQNTTPSASGGLSTTEVSRNLDEAGVMLKSLYVLAKSKLLSKTDNMASDMKQLISTQKGLSKLANSKKAANQDLSGKVHTLLDQIHAATSKVCSAIGRNAPVLAERAGKGKKADVIKAKSSQAINSFNQLCSQVAQAHTNVDMTKILYQLATQEKALVAALKGK